MIEVFKETVPSNPSGVAPTVKPVALAAAVVSHMNAEPLTGLLALTGR